MRNGRFFKVCRAFTASCKARKQFVWQRVVPHDKRRNAFPFLRATTRQDKQCRCATAGRRLPKASLPQVRGRVELLEQILRWVCKVWGQMQGRVGAGCRDEWGCGRARQDVECCATPAQFFALPKRSCAAFTKAAWLLLPSPGKPACCTIHTKMRPRFTSIVIFVA